MLFCRFWSISSTRVGRFEELRQLRHVVAHIVHQARIAHRRRAFVRRQESRNVVAHTFQLRRVTRQWRRAVAREQPLRISSAVERRPARRPVEAIFARNGIPLLPIIGRIDQRVSEIAQGALIVGQFEFRGHRSGGIRADPIVHAVAHQRGTDFAEIAVGGAASGEQQEGGGYKKMPAPNERPRQRRRRISHRWLAAG